MYRYEVIVGNIGMVYRGDNERQAMGTYLSYKELSKAGYGRAAGETVTLLSSGEPLFEYQGDQN